MWRNGAGALALAVMGSLGMARAEVFAFEDLPLGNPTLDGSAEYETTGTYYWNGSNGAGEFRSDLGFSEAVFVNSYNAEYFSWDGFAYSNTTDTTTADYSNQYSAITGGGFGDSSTYVVGYQPYVGDWTTGFPAPVDFTGGGIYVTNTTYTYFTMLDGNDYSEKFGGATGTDQDWFLLTIEGWNDGVSLGTVDFYLADYRFENSAQDYIVDEWAFVDLSAFGTSVDELTFSLSSSDTGEFGMNTPAYFALGGIAAVPEPSAGLLLGAGVLGLLWLGRRRNGTPPRPAALR